MKIDIFCHIFPKPFYERMLTLSGRSAYMQKRVREIPILIDLDLRLRVMDQFQPYVQLFSLSGPPIELLGDPTVTPELARIANDGMAEIVAKYPDRFPGFVASVPMNNPAATVEEIDRAVKTLGAKGIQVFTNVNGHPLDEPRFRPIFQRMAELDRPIWLHPARPASMSDYASEPESKYELWWVFGWPYETSVAMSRIVFAGYFDQFPNLHIIAHHMGAMIPHFAGRVGPGLDQLGTRTEGEDLSIFRARLKKTPIEYFKMFWVDTALFGAGHAIQCGLEFFDLETVMFASDSPFDPEKGPGYIRETIKNIDALKISNADRQAIYEGNARRLLHIK